MVAFSPAAYLRGLGWGGPGEGLNDSPNARAKALTVPMKKTLSGVGKDRDTAFPWWEMVFANVAGKVSGAGAETTESRRTATGILSHLPPPKPTAYSHLEASRSASGINMTAMGQAKMEAARKQLYSGFLRGAMIGGSEEEEPVILSEVKKVIVEVEVVKEKKEKKRKRVEQIIEEEDETTPSSSEGETEVKLSKEERREAKRQKKLAKEAVIPTPELPTPKSKKSKSSSSSANSTIIPPTTSISAEDLAYEESKEIARRAAKQERKLEKIAKKASKEKAKGSK